jgi:ligand-binding sensor domain-containing protein
MRSFQATTLLALTGLAASAGALHAQSYAPPPPVPDLGLPFEHVGLPGADFNPTIVQDPKGTLWFGTKHGLVRYDGGGRSTVFQPDPATPGAVAFDYIEKLYVDRSGTLWVGTYGGGLDRYDAATQSFTHFKHDASNANSLSEDHVTSLLEDRDGNLWIGSRGGLDRFDRKTGTFTHFKHDANDPNSLSENQMRAFYEDRQGNLWFGTQNGGLNRFDKARGTFVHYQSNPNDETSIIPGLIGAIFEDSQGRLWIGSGRETGGLNLMDRAKGTFTRFRFDPASSDWASKPQPQGPWTGGGVTSILEDRAGNFWFGVWQGGWVSRLDTKTGVSKSYQVSLLDAATAKESHPFKLFQSNDGTLWIGTVFGPSYKLSPAALR